MKEGKFHRQGGKDGTMNGERWT